MEFSDEFIPTRALEFMLQEKLLAYISEMGLEENVTEMMDSMYQANLCCDAQGLGGVLCSRSMCHGSGHDQPLAWRLGNHHETLASQEP